MESPNVKYQYYALKNTLLVMNCMFWILKAVYLGDPAQFYPNPASL